MQGLKDEEVMLEYQKGVTEAMDELLNRYKNPIYAFAFRLSRDATEAQDITQEVFLRVHQYRQSYAACGSFRTWIFSIAHNLCVSRFRKAKWLASWPKKNTDCDEPKEFSSPDPSPKDIAAGNEFAAVLKQCIQGLPFLQREALILREYEKLDYQEIAKILKKSLGTIKTLIHRARCSLKEKLLPYLEEAEGGL